MAQYPPAGSVSVLVVSLKGVLYNVAVLLKHHDQFFQGFNVPSIEKVEFLPETNEMLEERVPVTF